MNGMNGTGMNPADIMALTQGNSKSEPWWPLIWFALIANGGMGFGGTRDTATADALGRISQDTSAAAVAAANQTSTLLQAGASNNAMTAEAMNRIAADQAACCCNTQLGIANQTTALQLGLAGVNADVASKFAALQLQACNDTRDLQAQIAQCCCDNRIEALRTQNEIDKTACATQVAIQMQTMTLTQESTRNTQAIIDKLNQQNIDLLNDRIDEKDQVIAEQRLALSQSNQNNVLVATIQAQTNAILAAIQATCGGSSS